MTQVSKAQKGQKVVLTLSLMWQLSFCPREKRRPFLNSGWKILSIEGTAREIPKKWSTLMTMTALFSSDDQQWSGFNSLHKNHLYCIFPFGGGWDTSDCFHTQVEMKTALLTSADQQWSGFIPLHNNHLYYPACYKDKLEQETYWSWAKLQKSNVFGNANGWTWESWVISSLFQGSSSRQIFIIGSLWSLMPKIQKSSIFSCAEPNGWTWESWIISSLFQGTSRTRQILIIGSLLVLMAKFGKSGAFSFAEPNEWTW